MKKAIKFSLFPKKVNGVLCETLPIRVRVSYGGNRVELRLGYSIEPAKWKTAEERVTANARNRFGQSAGEINREILKTEERINEIFTRFELLEHRAPTPEELKAAYEEANGKRKPGPQPEESGLSFYRAYSEFMETMGRQNAWSKATYTKFNSLREHLQRYSKALSFEGLNTEALQGFIISLQEEGLRNTTISKYLSFFRWFLRWARNKGYNPSSDYENFKPRLKGVDGNAKEIIYLEWEELISLFNFEFPAKRTALSAVRDVFCFCCFTGLRYSDVAKLRRSDIRENYIKVVTQKTVDGLIIELNKYSRAILERYSHIELPNDKALPVISNAKMNEQLKIMAEIAGLDTPQRIVYFKGSQRYEEVLPKYAVITTHCARRTFVVNALRLGVPAEVVMKWTGHSDYKAMKPYIKIVDKLKVEEMGKFDNFEPNRGNPNRNPKR